MKNLFKRSFCMLLIYENEKEQIRCCHEVKYYFWKWKSDEIFRIIHKYNEKYKDIKLKSITVF